MLGELQIKIFDVIMHQSFVTTAHPPTGKGGDYSLCIIAEIKMKR